MAWASLVTEFIKFINNLLALRNPQKQIIKVNNIYDEMHRVLETSPVERLLVLKAHNGGGVIKASGELLSSVLYEDYRHPFKTVKSNYQKLPVDKEYAKMLLEIIQNGKIAYDIDSMPDSMLKGLYQSEGVKSSVVHYLCQDKKAVYFCTFANGLNLNEWYDSKQSAQLIVSANNIRQNIK